MFFVFFFFLFFWGGGAVAFLPSEGGPTVLDFETPGLKHEEEQQMMTCGNGNILNDSRAGNETGASSVRGFVARGDGATHPAVDLAPPPAVGPRLGVDLHHVPLLQRQLPGVAGAEVVPCYRHADHFGSEH